MPAAGKKGTVVRHGHGHVRASAQDRRDREQQDSGNRVSYPAGGCPSCREKKEEETPKKGFWSFIRPGRKNRPICSRRNSWNASDSPLVNIRVPHLSRACCTPLDREVTDMQKAERERLLEQMDLLYSNNTDLNHRLHRIVRDFEADAGIRLDERYRQFISTRDRSFHTVSLLAVLISLLTVLLYLIIHRDLNRINQYQRQLEASIVRTRSSYNPENA